RQPHTWLAIQRGQRADEEIGTRADAGEDRDPQGRHAPQEFDSRALHDGELRRRLAIDVPRRHVRTLARRTMPPRQNTVFGTQAARFGFRIASAPMARVTWMRMRNVMVMARLRPMPHAAPPRCVLVAKGAPNIAMMMQVIGMAILSARSTLMLFTSLPERSMARIYRPSSA